MAGLKSLQQKNAISSTFADLMNNQADGGFNPVLHGNAVQRDMQGLLQLGETGKADSKSIRQIDKNKIYPNPLNKKYMEGVKQEVFTALMVSILEGFLYHNLVVLDDGEGMFRLISGEKRWTAICMMSEEDYKRKFPNGVLCQVIPYNSSLTEVDELIMILVCNVLIASGEPDPTQVRDLVKAYVRKGYEKKELVEFLSIYLENSTSTLYKLIDESKAIDEFVALYDNKKMQRAALQVFGTMKEDNQRAAYQYICDNQIEKVDENIAGDLRRTFEGQRGTGRRKKGGEENLEKSTNSLAYTSLKRTMGKARDYLDKSKKADFTKLQSIERELFLSEIKGIESLVKEIEIQLKNSKNE